MRGVLQVARTLVSYRESLHADESFIVLHPDGLLEVGDRFTELTGLNQTAPEQIMRLPGVGSVLKSEAKMLLRFDRAAGIIQQLTQLDVGVRVVGVHGNGLPESLVRFHRFSPAHQQQPPVVVSFSPPGVQRAGLAEMALRLVELPQLAIHGRSEERRV